MTQVPSDALDKKLIERLSSYGEAELLYESKGTRNFTHVVITLFAMDATIIYNNLGCCLSYQFSIHFEYMIYFTLHRTCRPTRFGVAIIHPTHVSHDQVKI